MTQVFLSLGSNIEPRELHMESMARALSRLLLPPMVRSSLMETEPVETGPQAWYLNMVVAGAFGGSARGLLDSCKRIEDSLGRTGRGTKAPRTADIDILLFGEEVISEPGLIVPHPRLRYRRFCLDGLAQLAPGLVVPGLGESVRRLIERAPDEVRKQRVGLIDKEDGAACGPSGVGARAKRGIAAGGP
jgi:2-amino-4-hydroxy-6-hydroxymethyldihydropteridine diphosphokinase